MSTLQHVQRLADVFAPTKGAPSELDSSVSKVLGFIAWVGTAAGVVGILAVGTMMAVSVKRGEGSEHMGKLAMVLGGCVLVATGGPIIKFLFN